MVGVAGFAAKGGYGWSVKKRRSFERRVGFGLEGLRLEDATKRLTFQRVTGSKISTKRVWCDIFLNESVVSERTVVVGFAVVVAWMWEGKSRCRVGGGTRPILDLAASSCDQRSTAQHTAHSTQQ